MEHCLYTLSVIILSCAPAGHQYNFHTYLGSDRTPCYVYIARLQIRACFWLQLDRRGSIANVKLDTQSPLWAPVSWHQKKDSFLPTIRGYGGVHLGMAKEISNLFFHSNGQSCYKTRNQAYR